MTEPLRCSFCNKAQKEIRKLIAGPHVYICDECVDVCVGVLTEEGIPAGSAGKKAISQVTQAEAHLLTGRTLLATPDLVGAVREIRSSAVCALRGLCVLTQDQAPTWSETKIIVTALEEHPSVAAPLQQIDAAHLILRVSTAGAVFTEAEVSAALLAAEALVTYCRSQAEAGIQPRSRSGA
jgi:hypothetical protein